MLSSPACWRIYGEHLAFEYSDPELLPIHRLSVDTYAAQHPGDESRQAIQSVGLHLARLMVQLESPHRPEESNDVMLRLGVRKDSLIRLTPPNEFKMTMAQVRSDSGSANHAESVQAWARHTWDDWSEHHAYIRDWVSGG